jgi:hypothetical protein
LEQEKGADYLAMQRATFAPTSWRHAGGDVECNTTTGTCTLSVVRAPPSVAAVWVRANGLTGV